MTSNDADRSSLTVLGPVALQVDGRPVPVGGPLSRRLLGMLLVHRDAVVSADRLVEVLWGDDPPDTATSSLHTYVSRLRRLLPSSARLETVPPGYRLLLDRGSADVERFEAAVARGMDQLPHAPEGALRSLDEAMAEWQGDAYAEFRDEWWARAEASRLEELRLQAREARVEALLGSGRDEAAVSGAQAITEEHPGRERAWRALVLGLHRSGRQGEALRCANRYRAHLRDELGLDPSEEFTALEQAVAVDASSLRAASPAVIPLPAPLRVVPTVTFVGRADELTQLEQAWAAAAEQRQLVLVSGEPGAGKTRLAAEFARRLHADGVAVLFGGAEEDLGLPYQPVVEALEHLANAVGDEQVRRWAGRGADDLGHFLPRLGGAAEWERHQLFGAMVDLLRGLTARGPVLWLLDDLQWAGRPSMLLLGHVLRVAPELPLLIVATHRDPEVDRDDALAELLVDLRRREGVGRLRLNGLAVADVTSLVGDESLARTLVESTGGNPYFLTELYRHLQEGGSPDHPPAGAADVIAHRVARLLPEAATVLTLGAVIGFSFELDLLQVAHQDPVVDALEAAQRAHLIEEQPGPALAYRFPHALARAALYDRLSAAHRARLHHDVAVAFEKLYADPSPVLTDLARHWSEAAVLGHTETAVNWCRRAAVQASAAFGFEEAADHLRRALDVAGPQAPPRLRAELLVKRAQALDDAGLPTSSLDAAVDAAALAAQHGWDDLLVGAALSFGGHVILARHQDRQGRVLVQAALDRCPVGTIDHACLLSKLAALSVYVLPVEERLELCASALEVLAGSEALAGRRRVLSEFGTAINPRFDHPMYAQVLDELASVSSGRGVDWRWNYQQSRAEQVVTMGDGTAFRALLTDFDGADKLSDASRTWLLADRAHVAVWDGDLTQAELLFTEAGQVGQRETRSLALSIPALFGAMLGWLKDDMPAARSAIAAVRDETGGLNLEAVWAWVQLSCGEPGPAQELLSGLGERQYRMFLRFVAGGQGLAASSLAAVALADRQAMAKVSAVWDEVTVELYTSSIMPALAKAYYQGILAHGLGDLGRAEERLRHSLVVHERMTALPYQAASRAALAAVLADAGHVDEARGLALDAAESSRRIGALGITRQADGVLTRLDS